MSRTRGRQDRRYTGQEVGRTGGRQDRRETRQAGGKTGGRQDSIFIKYLNALQFRETAI